MHSVDASNIHFVVSGVNGSSKFKVSDVSVEDVTRLGDALDIFWLIFGSALVFMMQVGFTFLEVGSVSSKNTKSILLKNVCDMTVSALCYWMVGYAFQFGEGNGFIGYTDFFLTNKAIVSKSGSVTFDPTVAMSTGMKYAKWMYSYSFCAIATTIASGPTAERIQLRAYCIYAFFMSAWIYPVIGHWVWSDFGWASTTLLNGLGTTKLFEVGAVDIAGCGAVHICGGMVSLVAAYMLGARVGRFDAEGQLQYMVQQSSTYQTIGVFLLWFGWYGFNSVSTMTLHGGSGVTGATHADLAALAMVNTTLAAAAGSVSVTLVAYFHERRLITEHANNGIIAGLISITSACAVVDPVFAIVGGIVAGPIYYYSTKLLYWVHIDDVVQAVPCHLFVGLWGLLLPGFFTNEDLYVSMYGENNKHKVCGVVFEGCSYNLLLANFVFALAVAAFTAANAFVLFSVLHSINWLRLPFEGEETGMDMMFFKERDNAEFVETQEWNEKLLLTLLSHGNKNSALDASLLRAISCRDSRVSQHTKNFVKNSLHGGVLGLQGAGGIGDIELQVGRTTADNASNVGVFRATPTDLTSVAVVVADSPNGGNADPSRTNRAHARIESILDSTGGLRPHLDSLLDSAGTVESLISPKGGVESINSPRGAVDIEVIKIDE